MSQTAGFLWRSWTWGDADDKKDSKEAPAAAVEAGSATLQQIDVSDTPMDEEWRIWIPNKSAKNVQQGILPDTLYLLK